MNCAVPTHYKNVPKIKRDALRVIALSCDSWPPSPPSKSFFRGNVDVLLAGLLRGAQEDIILATRNKPRATKQVVLLCIMSCYAHIDQEAPLPFDDSPTMRVFLVFLHKYTLELLCGIITPSQFVSTAEKTWGLF